MGEWADYWYGDETPAGEGSIIDRMADGYVSLPIETMRLLVDTYDSRGVLTWLNRYAQADEEKRGRMIRMLEMTR